MTGSLFETKRDMVFNLREDRDYQARSYVDVRKAVLAGWRCPVLYLPTGGGKTHIATKIIANALSRGKRVLFVVPLLSLLRKTIQAFEAQGITDIGVIQRRHSRTDPGARVQVASKQTLIKRPELMQGFDVVLDDECFPAGTLISTPRGPKPIDQMTPGDLVTNASGTGRVLSLFKKSHNKFVTVRLSDGRSFRCTPDHPVFTLSGWVEAGNLVVRQRVFREKDVLVLRESVRSVLDSDRNPQGPPGGRIELREARMLLSVLREEAEEPNAFGGHSGENVVHAETNRPRPTSRRKRTADAPAAVGDISHTRKGVGFGASGQISSKTSDVRLLLQAGYSEFGSDDRNRIGWWESLLAHSAGTGSEERRSASLVWVEDIAAEELTCAEPVYNLRVSGHPSYFANGFLVHNCHKMYSEFNEWMKRDTKTVFIGLSATPGTRGMGLVWDGVVVGATISELLEKGAICPFEFYGPEKPPSRKDLKIVAGDFKESETETLMSGKALVADVYKMWVERGSRAKWFVFGQTCAHTKLLMEDFVKEGVRCGYIDADTPQEERDSDDPDSDAILCRYRRGEIDVMFSVGCLGTGVDELVYGISLAYITRSRDKLTQDLGRGGRPAPGKQVCWVNDHGGNIENLGMPEDYDYSLLDTKDPKEKGDARIDESAPPTPKKCGGCHMLLPPKTSICPNCGEKPVVCTIEVRPGKLVKKEKPAPVNKEHQRFYSELIHLGKKSGFKPNWATMKFITKFGIPPSGLKYRGKSETSPEVKEFVAEQRRMYLASKKAVVDENGWANKQNEVSNGTPLHT